MKAPRPKKRVGQNFLVDQNVINEIISELKICDNDTFVEIGPGNVLTNLLKRNSDKVKAVSIGKFSDLDKLENI